MSGLEKLLVPAVTGIALMVNWQWKELQDCYDMHYKVSTEILKLRQEISDLEGRVEMLRKGGVKHG